MRGRTSNYDGSHGCYYALGLDGIPIGLVTPWGQAFWVLPQVFFSPRVQWMERDESLREEIAHVARGDEPHTC